MLGPLLGNTKYCMDALVVKLWKSSFLQRFYPALTEHMHTWYTFHLVFKLRFFSINTALCRAPKPFDACFIHLSTSGSIPPDDVIIEPRYTCKWKLIHVFKFTAIHIDGDSVFIYSFSSNYHKLGFADNVTDQMHCLLWYIHTWLAWLDVLFWQGVLHHQQTDIKYSLRYFSFPLHVYLWKSFSFSLKIKSAPTPSTSFTRSIHHSNH